MWRKFLPSIFSNLTSLNCPSRCSHLFSVTKRLGKKSVRGEWATDTCTPDWGSHLTAMILSPVGEAKRQELAFPNGSTAPVPINDWKFQKGHLPNSFAIFRQIYGYIIDYQDKKIRILFDIILKINNKWINFHPITGKSKMSFK